jgi:hypothetical protein
LIVLPVIPLNSNLITDAMQFSEIFVLLSAIAAVSSTPLSGSASNTLDKRASPQFTQGEPIDGNGKGAPILGKLGIVLLNQAKLG